MPIITLSAEDLAILRRCFGAATSTLANWDDDQDASISPVAATKAGAILAAARPGLPIAFAEAAWKAFACCCETGAELLDETRANGLTDAQCQAVTRLLQDLSVDRD